MARMTDAEIKNLVAEAWKGARTQITALVADARKGARTPKGETTEPLPVAQGPTSSTDPDDAFLVQGAEYENRGLKAFGDFIEGKNAPEPDLKGPGSPYNGRAWANLGEILEKERADRAAKADGR